MSDTDVLHSSAPVTVVTADATYTMWQHRADELAHPETWSEPSWVEVQITSRVAAAPDSGDGRTALSLSASLRPGELLALVGALTSAMAPGVTP